MGRTIKDYIKMVEELKALGSELLDKENGECWVDEVECMDMHLECCLNILAKVMR